MRPAARTLLTAPVLALAASASVPAAPSDLAAQAPRIVAAVEPDSVRVGEAFTVGVTVTQPTSGAVEFPAALALEADLEQRGPARIREEREGLEWRAYYTLVAWRADTIPLPPIELTLAATGSAVHAVSAPPIVVGSVLPDEAEEFELREARPFLRVSGFPWWVLLLFAAAAALAWWWWRRRASAVPALAARGPGAEALRAFERLRGDWTGGRLSGDGFYDRFEAVLRRYVRATRGWPPARGMVALPSGDSPLLEALRRSIIVRFARVGAGAEAPLSALDAGEGFVRTELGEDGGEGSRLGAVGPPPAAGNGRPAPEAPSGRADR